MIFLFQHPERREWRETTGTYGLYEWGSSGFAAAYGISLSRESRDRLYLYFTTDPMLVSHAAGLSLGL